MHIWMRTRRSRILYERNKPLRIRFIIRLNSLISVYLHDVERTPPLLGTVPAEVVETPETDDTDVNKSRRAWCDCGLKHGTHRLLYRARSSGYLIGEAYLQQLGLFTV